MTQTEKLKVAFENYFNALNTLKNLGVTQNKKDFTSQLGEWLVETLYDGKRAESGIQKHWDIDTPIGKIQVKTHSKSDKTNARWSNLKKTQTSEINFVVIIVFTKDYQLKEFYNAPWSIVYEKIREHKDADRIYWDDLADYKIQLPKLPKQEIISLFGEL